MHGHPCWRITATVKRWLMLLALVSLSRVAAAPTASTRGAITNTDNRVNDMEEMTAACLEAVDCETCHLPEQKKNCQERYKCKRGLQKDCDNQCRDETAQTRLDCALAKRKLCLDGTIGQKVDLDHRDACEYCEENVKSRCITHAINKQKACEQELKCELCSPKSEEKDCVDKKKKERWWSWSKKSSSPAKKDEKKSEKEATGGLCLGEGKTKEGKCHYKLSAVAGEQTLTIDAYVKEVDGIHYLYMGDNFFFRPYLVKKLFSKPVNKVKKLLSKPTTEMWDYAEFVATVDAKESSDGNLPPVHVYVHGDQMNSDQAQELAGVTKAFEKEIFKLLTDDKPSFFLDRLEELPDLMNGQGGMDGVKKSGFNLHIDQEGSKFSMQLQWEIPTDVESQEMISHHMLCGDPLLCDALTIKSTGKDWFMRLEIEGTAETVREKSKETALPNLIGAPAPTTLSLEVKSDNVLASSPVMDLRGFRVKLGKGTAEGHTHGTLSMCNGPNKSGTDEIELKLEESKFIASKTQAVCTPTRTGQGAAAGAPGNAPRLCFNVEKIEYGPANGIELEVAEIRLEPKKLFEEGVGVRGKLTVESPRNAKISLDRDLKPPPMAIVKGQSTEIKIQPHQDQDRPLGKFSCSSSGDFVGHLEFQAMANKLDQGEFVDGFNHFFLDKQLESRIDLTSQEAKLDVRVGEEQKPHKMELFGHDPGMWAWAHRLSAALVTVENGGSATMGTSHVKVTVEVSVAFLPWINQQLTAVLEPAPNQFFPLKTISSKIDRNSVVAAGTSVHFIDEPPDKGLNVRIDTTSIKFDGHDGPDPASLDSKVDRAGYKLPPLIDVKKTNGNVWTAEVELMYQCAQKNASNVNSGCAVQFPRLKAIPEHVKKYAPMMQEALKDPISFAEPPEWDRVSSSSSLQGDAQVEAVFGEKHGLGMSQPLADQVAGYMAMRNLAQVNADDSNGPEDDTDCRTSATCKVEGLPNRAKQYFQGCSCSQGVKALRVKFEYREKAEGGGEATATVIPGRTGGLRTLMSKQAVGLNGEGIFGVVLTKIEQKLTSQGLGSAAVDMAIDYFPRGGYELVRPEGLSTAFQMPIDSMPAMSEIGKTLGLENFPTDEASFSSTSAIGTTVKLQLKAPPASDKSASGSVSSVSVRLPRWTTPGKDDVEFKFKFDPAHEIEPLESSGSFFTLRESKNQEYANSMAVEIGGLPVILEAHSKLEGKVIETGFHVQDPTGFFQKVNGKMHIDVPSLMEGNIRVELQSVVVQKDPGGNELKLTSASAEVGPTSKRGERPYMPKDALPGWAQPPGPIQVIQNPTLLRIRSQKAEIALGELKSEVVEFRATERSVMLRAIFDNSRLKSRCLQGSVDPDGPLPDVDSACTLRTLFVEAVRVSVGAGDGEDWKVSISAHNVNQEMFKAFGIAKQIPEEIKSVFRLRVENVLLKDLLLQTIQLDTEWCLKPTDCRKVAWGQLFAEEDIDVDD